MDWREIDELFKMGTIDEGIPEGYGYGIAVVQRGGAIVQVGMLLYMLNTSFSFKFNA
jgi:hypothetical protein